MIGKFSRVDKNQDVIVQALRKVGCSVFDTSKIGKGFPDLVIAFKGENYLIEVKNPESSYGRKGFNKNQQKFSDNWQGSKIHIVNNVDEALRVIGVEV